MHGRRAGALLLLASLLLAGCTGNGPEPPTPAPVRVPPPEDGGGHAPCASRSAQPLAMGFTSEEVDDAMGYGPGLHRVDARIFLWVWGSYNGTLREDEVSRVSEVLAYQEPDGRLVLCTRVDLLAPVEVDDEPRTYDVAVRYRAHAALPPAPLRFVVNWVAGCGPCGNHPEGNATAHYPAPHARATFEP